MPPKDNAMETCSIDSTESSRDSKTLMLPKSESTNTMILELEIEEDASTSTTTSTTTDRIDQNNVNNKKVVSFNEDVIVHEVTHLKDIDEQTKKDVWYTELYLRMMRCNMMPGNDDDDDDYGDNSNDDTLQSFMKARNIRRSRQLVMAEQARQKRYTNSNGNGNDGRDGETLIQNEYCRVATTSQADATQRGRVMASKALKIRKQQQQQKQ